MNLDHVMYLFENFHKMTDANDIVSLSLFQTSGFSKRNCFDIRYAFGISALNFRINITQNPYFKAVLGDLFKKVFYL